MTMERSNKLPTAFDFIAEYEGHSLDYCLLQGPYTTLNLVGMLLLFRKNSIALATDSEKMIMQVWAPAREMGIGVSCSWRGAINCNDSVIESQMTPRPFGAIVSPLGALLVSQGTPSGWDTAWSNRLSEWARQTLRRRLYCIAANASRNETVRNVHQNFIENSCFFDCISGCSVIRNSLCLSTPQFCITAGRTVGWNGTSMEDSFRFKFIIQVKPRGWWNCCQWSHQYFTHWDWFSFLFC